MRKNKTEQQRLQNYGVLFKNAKFESVLAGTLAEYGYDTATVEEGEALYNTLIEKYNANKTESAQETTAYAVFDAALETTLATYSTDRKKAKIVFKDQPDVLKNLHIKGIAPVRNAALIDTMRLFYETLNTNTQLLNALQRLKITADHVNQQLTNVANTQNAYAAYIQEKGESQQATQDKNKAFDTVTKWVNEFYAVAKIALDDQPQLLESVAKLVRS
ncbi:MAG: hypothetical protein RSF68_13025 [Myroides sp.]